jgi:hypothetical protein
VRGEQLFDSTPQLGVAVARLDQISLALRSGRLVQGQ